MLSVQLPEFGKALATSMQANIIDQTGLSGGYDVRLRWATDDSPDRPSILTAIQEHLGLKLESIRAPTEVIVINHVERPSEN